MLCVAGFFYVQPEAHTRKIAEVLGPWVLTYYVQDAKRKMALVAVSPYVASQKEQEDRA